MPTEDKTVVSHWLAADMGIIRGYFTKTEIRSFLIAKAMTIDTQVSETGILFEPIHQVPQLIPDSFTCHINVMDLIT